MIYWNFDIEIGIQIQVEFVLLNFEIRYYNVMQMCYKELISLSLNPKIVKANKVRNYLINPE